MTWGLFSVSLREIDFDILILKDGCFGLCVNFVNDFRVFINYKGIIVKVFLNIHLLMEMNYDL